MNDYRHTPEMGTISGFGAEADRGPQELFAVGARWLESNGHLTPEKIAMASDAFEGRVRAGGFEPTTPAARALYDVLDAHHAALAEKDGLSGAAFVAVVRRLFHLAGTGWDGYVAECVRRESEA